MIMPKECAECIKNINEAHQRHIEWARAEVLAECLKIIDMLGETRGKDNGLTTIKLGDRFMTNSIEMLKEELKQKIQALQSQQDNNSDVAKQKLFTQPADTRKGKSEGGKTK